jgi:chromosome segregation ATPase
LFDTTPSTVENNPSASITPTNEPYHCNVSSLLRDLKNAECQRDLAMNARDVAFLERDRAFKERDELRAQNASYIELRDAAYLKSDSVKAECYRLIMQRDQAMEEHDLLIAENNNNAQKLAAVESELSILRRVIEELSDEKQQLLERNNNATAQLAVYAKRQSRLSDRVTALENHHFRYTQVDLRSTRPKCAYVLKFVNKLFPEVVRNSQGEPPFVCMWS